MAQQTRDTFQIVLEKVPEEHQQEAAKFLSGCFSLPLPATRSIAGSGPIAILSDMEKEQAEAVFAEVVATVPEGVHLHVASSTVSNISRLQWPRPPRIYGRELGDFMPSDIHEVKCPYCGNALRITQDDGAFNAEPIESKRPPEVERRRRSDTVAHPAPTGDPDPLFSGIKPVADSTSSYASIRSLQAGDTGFWMDYNRNLLEPQDAAATSSRKGTDTSQARRYARGSAGLSAFMRPGSFAVVVGRTRDVQTIKMIAEIMGISESEAREQALSLGLCVARNIALDEAQTLLARFNNLGAKARIVKPM